MEWEEGGDHDRDRDRDRDNKHQVGGCVGADNGGSGEGGGIVTKVDVGGEGGGKGKEDDIDTNNRSDNETGKGDLAGGETSRVEIIKVDLELNKMEDS